MKTAQEIYDTVRDGLLAQGARSLDSADGGCVYRGTEGRKCAVGHLIDDAHYDPVFEGVGVGLPLWSRSEAAQKRVAILDAALVASGVSFEHRPLLRALQAVHDEPRPVGVWGEELRRVARSFGLNP